ncbi:MAG: hypothetical protein HYY06_01385 [Deltaproteobacteria bacterium]|nr:hypothetical protein [Deltaproteobacteria bacterium]
MPRRRILRGQEVRSAAMRTVMPILVPAVFILSACGPENASEAEANRDVSWLGEHAKAGEAEAMASLCKLATEGVDGSSAALVAARAGKDPNQHLESVACMIDLALAGDGAFAAPARELIAAPATPVRLAAMNALAAASTDAARRASLQPFLADVKARLRDDEEGIWRRALNVLYNQGPLGRRTLAAALEVPEPTRRRELTRRIADFTEISPELGPPALAWIVSGEAEVFDKLEGIVVRSGMAIGSAKSELLTMYGSNADAKIDSALHLARAFADEGRCDAEVVRATLEASSRTTMTPPEVPPDQELPEERPVGPFPWCEEPCLVQVRGVAYRCRQVGDAVLREVAARPAIEGPAGQPREIARATLGI